MSNLLDKASILTTPTAYDNGGLLSVKPIDGSGDFNFSRNSSATRVNSQGLIESVTNNLPRIDYTDGVGSWLFEEQSTNKVLYSEDFSNSNWTKSSNVVLSNNYLSPKGSNDAYSIGHDGTTAQYVATNIISLPNGNVTVSVFLKKGTKEWVALGVSNICAQYFNINTNTLGSNVFGPPISTKFENYPNDWVKISMTVLGNGSAQPVRIYIAESSNSVNCTGNVGDNLMYLFGVQVEDLSYNTSYIPTNGSTVTRLQEVCNTSNNVDLINSIEGILYMEVAAISDTTFQQIGIFSSTTSDQVRIQLVGSFIEAQLYNGAYQTNMRSTQAVKDFNKIAFKYKENDFALWINGTKVSIDNSGTTFSANSLDRLRIVTPKVNIKSIAVFKEALTDEELTCLTTI